MSQSLEQISEKIKIYILTRAELLIHLCLWDTLYAKYQEFLWTKVDFVTWNSTQHIHRPCIFFEMGASKAELLTLQIRGRPRLIRDSSTLISFWLLPVPLSCSTSHCHELGSSRTPSCQTTWKEKKMHFFRGGNSGILGFLKQFPMSLNFSSYFEK